LAKNFIIYWQIATIHCVSTAHKMEIMLE